MIKTIGIRREDKNKWEIRVPIIPETVKHLKQQLGINFIVQPFKTRAFRDEEYLENGAEINEDLSNVDVIFAVKEIPINLILKNKIYLFFSHTIKGQSYNMPMLQALLDKNCTLIDYECIKDSSGKRLVFFGRYAGLAGMIDALYGLGKRLNYLGKQTPFIHVKPAYEYHDLEDAKLKIKIIAEEIFNFGLSEPLVFGFAGYGNVSKGAQEIFDLLPYINLSPDELVTNYNNLENKIYKVVFDENYMVRPKSKDDKFELKDYFQNPIKYESRFEEFLPYINVLINAIYWDNRYPRLVTKEYLKKNNNGKLILISDISCDIDGAIEITYKATKPDNPAYVYNVKNDKYTDGFEGEGVVNMAVDNLPCELAKDSSISFSNSLEPFIKEIIEANFDEDFENLKVSDIIKNAIICYKGKLTPNYKYIEKYLK